MNDIYYILLKAMRTSLHCGQLKNLNLSKNDWESIMRIAKEQKIESLIYESVSCDQSFKNIDSAIRKQYQESAFQNAVRQITQTNEFLTLILHAQKQGLDPIVLKGIICRELYLKPMLRSSVDEDLLICPEDTEKYHKFFLSEGLFLDTPKEKKSLDDMVERNELEELYELSYHKNNSPTYIELHKYLFEPKSQVYGDFNDLFPGLLNKNIKTMHVQIEDVSVCTLAPTEHLLYLFLHAFKHFSHSGIGIRPVCDIGMFAEHYAKEIEWDYIKNSLEKVNAFYFCSALIRIVQAYLLPDAVFFKYIEKWNIEKIEIKPLLEDILASGVHGASSKARLHSSNITLDAITSQKQGRKKSQKKIREFLRVSLLPSAENLESRYPYIKKMPILIPVAWLQRGVSYLKENHSANTMSDAAASLRLGEKRIRLLEQYRIVNKE